MSDVPSEILLGSESADDVFGRMLWTLKLLKFQTCVLRFRRVLNSATGRQRMLVIQGYARNSLMAKGRDTNSSYPGPKHDSKSHDFKSHDSKRHDSKIQDSKSRTLDARSSARVMSVDACVLNSQRFPRAVDVAHICVWHISHSWPATGAVAALKRHDSNKQKVCVQLQEAQFKEAQLLGS
jgi:hypothetical protein